MYRLTLIVTLLSAPAVAQDLDCANAMAQLEMNLCAEQDWQAADAALNAAYQRVVAAMKAMDAELPPELQGAEDALRSAQRAWIDYRDGHCTVAGFPMRGGSAEPLLVYGCLRQVTENRTAELLALLAF